MHKIELIINNGDKKKAQIQWIKKKAWKEESETKNVQRIEIWQSVRFKLKYSNEKISMF